MSTNNLATMSFTQHMSIKQQTPPSAVPTKLDRRQRRTRRLLAEALIALIPEKGYDTLSITDITDRADLNRATFYLHYGSKEELLMDLLEERFDELVAEMEANRVSDGPIWLTHMPELRIYEHLAEHHALYAILLGNQAVGHVVKRVLDYIADVVERHTLADMPQGFESPIPLPLMSRFVAGAMYAQLVWWLENDMPYPPEYMARLTHTLCMRGTIELWQSMLVVQIPHLAEIGGLDKEGSD